MRKFLYIAIGIIVVGLVGGLGNRDVSKPVYTQAMAKTSGAPPCLVNLEKFNAMKDGPDALAFSRDGAQMAYGAMDGSIRLLTKIRP